MLRWPKFGRAACDDFTLLAKGELALCGNHAALICFPSGQTHVKLGSIQQNPASRCMRPITPSLYQRKIAVSQLKRE
jgi:hypothetical protein